MKYQKLKKEAFHSMCRQCINEQYGLQLKTPGLLLPALSGTVQLLRKYQKHCGRY